MWGAIYSEIQDQKFKLEKTKSSIKLRNNLYSGVGSEYEKCHLRKLQDASCRFQNVF